MDQGGRPERDGTGKSSSKWGTIGMPSTLRQSDAGEAGWRHT